MPAVQAPAKVLVTGASGYIAAWLVKSLIDRGFIVRGSVRSKEKGEWIQANYPAGKFEYVIVKEIEAPGAFDEAVKGVDAVAHTASPVVFGDNLSPEALITPAVHGTVGILQSVKDHGPSVKRVVITSSGASIIEPKPIPWTFSEKDWNTFSLREVEEKGIAASGLHKYRASKTLAERAAWDFVKSNPGLGFDVVTILPSFVFGPFIHQADKPESLNLTVKMLYDGFKTEKTPEEVKAFGVNFVDVRDVADAHADALQIEKAGGERIIASSGSFTWQAAYDALNSGPYSLPGIPKGTPGSGDEVIIMSYDNSKIKSLFGTKFRPLGETMRDSVLAFRDRGW